MAAQWKEDTGSRRRDWFMREVAAVSRALAIYLLSVGIVAAALGAYFLR